MLSCRLSARPGRTSHGASLDPEVRSNHSLPGDDLDGLAAVYDRPSGCREKRNVVLDLDWIVLDTWKDGSER